MARIKNENVQSKLGAMAKLSSKTSLMPPFIKQSLWIYDEINRLYRKIL